MNIRPDSRTPRRFPQAMNQMAKTDIQTRYGYVMGNADVIAAIPAATETETAPITAIIMIKIKAACPEFLHTCGERSRTITSF